MLFLINKNYFCWHSYKSKLINIALEGYQFSFKCTILYRIWFIIAISWYNCSFLFKQVSYLRNTVNEKSGKGRQSPLRHKPKADKLMSEYYCCGLCFWEVAIHTSHTKTFGLRRKSKKLYVVALMNVCLNVCVCASMC